MVKALFHEYVSRYSAVLWAMVHWMVYILIFAGTMFVSDVYLTHDYPSKIALFTLGSALFELLVRCDRQVRIALYVVVIAMGCLGGAIIRDSGAIAANQPCAQQK